MYNNQSLSVFMT